MINKISHIAIGCCTVFFCAATCKAQYDTCAHLKQWEAYKPQPGDQVLAQEQFDTLKIYIRKCAAKDDDSFTSFNHLNAAIGIFSPEDTTKFDLYRDWLISVLYLNTTNPAYFCICLGSIAGTYGYGKYHIHNAGLAVLNYLRHNGNCDNPGLEDEYQQDIADLKANGEDTTLPSLNQIGLDFLLGAHSPAAPLTSHYLASFTTTPNPFTTEITLDFTLNRMAYIQLAIYDVLGRLVWGYGRASSLEAGEHTVHIDGKDLPSGILYARISTGFGEVQTVKIIHE